jgi:hypothetical protein
MTLFAKIKAVIAPKTEDSQYDEVRTVLLSSSIESEKYLSSLRNLLKHLHEFGRICQKCANDLTIWMTEEAPPQQSLTAKRVTDFARSFDDFTDFSLTHRIEPNFAAPFRVYETAVANLQKLKSQREDARKEFDKNREIQKQLETAKKPKQTEIDKAKVKTEEAQEKYERLNTQFIEEMTLFTEERRISLGDPFRVMIALFCKYIQEMSPEMEGFLGKGSEVVEVVEQKVFEVPAPEISAPFEKEMSERTSETEELGVVSERQDDDVLDKSPTNLEVKVEECEEEILPESVQITGDDFTNRFANGDDPDGE